MMPNRTFTRADVEAHFWTWFRVPLGEETCINAVWYLPGLGQPLWMIDCTTVDGLYRYHSRYLTMQEQRSDGTSYLIPPEHVELPEGCSTVADEDKAIKQRKKQSL